jgi:hypothetical protein
MDRRPLPPALKRHAPLALFLLLTAIGVARIAATYRPISQTSDEAPNIACGMQWLDLGLYDYGPFHPPLARIAMALGPYLYGARAQKLPDRWKEGNAVLASAPRYNKALALARMGILPFFALACLCVWLWSRGLVGEWGALAAVFLFTNLPPVLAHAGLATSDMAVSAGVSAAVLCLTRWLERPDWRRSVLLGCAFAAAFLSKFSSVVLVPACLVGIAAAWFWSARAGLPACLRGNGRPGGLPHRARRFAVALLVAGLLVWSAYRFSWGHMTEHVADDAAGQSGIWSHIPSAWLHALERAPLPAPQILDGLWQVHNHVDAGHAAYLLGRNSYRGWWYFFPVALAVKTPLGFLLLAAIGKLALFRERLRPFDWRWWAPLIGAAAILLVCLPATLNIGVRYMLPLYPLLAVLAGSGAVWLFRRRALWGRGLAAILMLWTAVSSVAAHPDYLAYFNEAAGSRPERILVDSDLDWGQDMNLLVKELRQRRVDFFHMAVLYTGDDTRLDLPAWEALEPFQPVTGWVAVSFTKFKTYGWVAAREKGRTENAFAWLDRYEPVARVGRSILLYDIPAGAR